MEGEASTPAKAVFLSYASEDATAAQRIAEALRAAGVVVWFDREELRGGDAWDHRIRQQIRDCRLFVPIISAHTDARLEGYFRREWKLAVDRTEDMASEVTFLVPVVIDDTPNASAHVPDRFRHVHWTRIRGGEPTPALITLISQLVKPNSQVTESSQGEQMASNTAPPVQMQRDLPGRMSRRRLAVLAGACAVAIIAAGYVGFNRLTHRAAGTTTISRAPTVAATDKSIAVLPFVDLSEKKDQEYLGDGLAEDVLDALAKIPGLRVVGRTSSFQFKGRTSDLQKIGSLLGATYVVEGTVRRSSDHVVVTAQLIDARDGAHRWSERYDREVADVLSLQRQIAIAIARELEVSVTDYFGVEGTTKSAEAYDLYLRGIRDVDSGSREPELRAVSEFTKAVEIDPGYVNAWIGLADAYDSAATDNSAPRAESYRLAREAVDRALTLDPKNADAYAMRAFIRMNTWDWSGAEDDIQRSLAVRRTIGAAQAASKLARARGDLVTSETLLRGVLAADPFDMYSLTEFAFVIYPRMHRFEESDRVIAKLRDIEPNIVYLNYTQAINALYEDHNEHALEFARQEAAEEFRETALAVIYSAKGDIHESDRALQRMLHLPTAPEFNIACIYAYRGERDLAFQHLDRAYEARSVDLLDLKTELLVASLRDDPRYKALLLKMNLPQ